MNTQVKALRNHGTVDRPRGPAAWIDAAHQAMARIPDDPIALLGRFSIAAVFWKSGQTKVDGLAIDLVDGSLQLGWPGLSDSAVALFREEYRLPLLPPELAANLAALLQLLGRSRQAEERYEQALELQEQIHGPGHPALAPLVTNLAAFYRDRGDHLRAELHRTRIASR